MEHARCNVIRDGRKGLMTVCFVWCFLNDCCIQHEGKVSLGRPRCRWEDNVKMDLQEGGCGVWTGSSWLRIGTVGGHL